MLLAPNHDRLNYMSRVVLVLREGKMQREEGFAVYFHCRRMDLLSDRPASKSETDLPVTTKNMHVQ